MEFLNSNFEIIVKMVEAEVALSSYMMKVPSTLVGIPSTLLGIPSTLLVMVTTPTKWHAAKTETDGRDVDDKDVGMALRCDMPEADRGWRPSIGIFVTAYCEFLEVIVRTVVDIEIYGTLDARQTACIGVLPEFPCTLVFYLGHIVVGYPVRIVFKDRRAEILLFKLIIGVKDGLYMILIFNNMQPCKNVLLKLFHTFISRFMFNIKHRWQVALLQMHLIKKMIGL